MAAVGIFDGGGDKAHGRQKQALLSEAQQAGCRVLEVVDIGAGQAFMGNAVSAMVGGSMRVDTLQVFTLDTNGWEHRFVQPFAGYSPLPGEHHAILTGCLGAPAILRQGGLFTAAAWDPNAGPEIAQYLGSAPALANATKTMQWTWKLGLSQIDLEWTFQLRSVGDGTTHVVMQTGRYGGITTYEVGFGQFLRMCMALHPCLGQAPMPAQPFVELPRYTDVLYPAAAPPAPAPAPDGVHVAIDYNAVVTQALASHLGKRVWVGSIPPKKLGNIQKHVVPSHLAAQPVLAAIDLTTFGSAKDAIVVTPTHIIVKEFDDVMNFELRAVQRLHPPGGMLASKLGLDVAGLGQLQIPVGMDEAPVRALLESVAAANTGASAPATASAFVGQSPQGVSMEQAQALQQQFQASMRSDAVGDKLNAAANLLTSGEFQRAADAYAAIATQHPERTGTCYGQIGAALFFLGRYEQAIGYYEAAKQHGEDPSMMDDNIAEARGMLPNG